MELIQAVQEGDLDRVRRLVWHEEVSGSEFGNRALRLAARNGHLEIVRFLLTENTSDRGLSWAFLEAVDGGHLEIARLFLEKDPELVHSDNETALVLQVEEENLEFVQMLVEYGARIRVNDDECLAKAVTQDNLEMVRFLIEHGAFVHMNHDFPLRRASENGNLEMVRMILESSSNFDLEQAIFFSVNEGRFEIVRYLIEQGANPSAGLYPAILNNQDQIVRFLLSKGAVPNVKPFGFVPNNTIMQLLLATGKFSSEIQRFPQLAPRVISLSEEYLSSEPSITSILELPHRWVLFTKESTFVLDR